MKHTLTFRILTTLFLALAAATASAGGGGSGGYSPGSGGTNGSGDNPFAGGEEIGSLPVVQDPTGLTLVGSPAEIRAIVLEVRGRGGVQLQRLGRGLVAVTLAGDLQVELDRSALARSSVRTLFRGGELFTGGVASLTLPGAAPMLFPADRLALPIGRLARTDFDGTGVVLDVFDARVALHGVATFDARRVTWVQHLR